MSYPKFYDSIESFKIVDSMVNMNYFIKYELLLKPFSICRIVWSF